jgi:transposase
MPAERLSMRKIREILQLRWGEKLSQRDVAHSVRVSPSTVFDCVSRAQLAGLGWPLPDTLDDAALEALLYPLPATVAQQPRAVPDWSYIHNELRRKGVTLQLLWHEYKQEHRDGGYQYSQFCELFKRYKGQLDVVLRQDYRAGEKAFVDFSGDGIPMVNPHTGEVSEAALFVAVLGASNFTYAEAFESQQLRHWIAGHIHAYEYFDGVPQITVPDNPKTAVLRPCWYDPELNQTYREMARHYNTAIIPARPRKPRDKAKVEGGVLIAQRWIVAALRNHTFFNIEQINEAIWDKLDELNDRKFQKLDGNRRQMYLQLDRPALRALPPSRYVYADWSRPKVNIDYHVDVERHYYSVPYTLIHKRLEARATATTVEMFFKGRRVASHVRSYVKAGHTTLREHMPPSHQRYLEWSPSRIISWAGTVGPAASAMCEKIMQLRAHAEQGYRACLGVMRLGKVYGNDRVERACERALSVAAVSYKSVESILKRGLDRKPLVAAAEPKSVEHDNVRGPDYYN